MMDEAQSSCEILSILNSFLSKYTCLSCLLCTTEQPFSCVSLPGQMPCGVGHTHTHTQVRRLRPLLIKNPFSLWSSCCPLLYPAETKRWGWRNGQPLIKFPPLFLSVPPLLFSYRFWALVLCDSQENKHASWRGTRILLFKCFFSSRVSKQELFGRKWREVTVRKD